MAPTFCEGFGEIVQPISLGLWGMMALDDDTLHHRCLLSLGVSSQGKALPPELICVNLCFFLPHCQSLLSTRFPAHKKTLLLNTPFVSTNAVGILAQPKASTAKGETKALHACGPCTGEKSCHHTDLGENPQCLWGPLMSPAASLVAVYVCSHVDTVMPIPT